MSAYSPASSVAWLDLDAAASERVSTLLRSLEEPGTLDPLGLGSVRDAFAAALSPGTSTGHTRLRYFIFLPWIFLRLEAERVVPGDFARRLRDSEARLIDCLRPLGPNQGVIGYSAGRDLQRMPSEVYWGGLGSWGLRRLDLSRAEYAKHAATLGRLRPSRDDDGNVTKAAAAMWAPMPDPPDDFLQAEIGFELRRDEAQLLVDHIRERHPGSLLAAMCTSPELAAGAAFPWSVPTSTLPGHVREVLQHARCFWGADRRSTARLQRASGPESEGRVRLGHRRSRDRRDRPSRRLAALVADRHVALQAWVDNLPAFWALLATYDTVSDRTQEFVEAIVTRAVMNPAGLVEDPTVQATIRTSEIQLKTKRARLAYRSALENWNQAPFGEQLNYRWPIAKSYLSDIATALVQSS